MEMNEETRLRAIAELDAEHKRLAVEIDKLASRMVHYAKVLRGEVQDLTGLGCRRILYDTLEHVMNIKILEPHQYEEYLAFQAMYRRQQDESQ